MDSILDRFGSYVQNQSSAAQLQKLALEEKRKREAEYQRRVDADLVGLGTSTPLMNILPTKAVTVPLAFGASIIKPIVKKALSRRANKYVGLSVEQKAAEVLKEFPKIVGEGWKNAHQIVARGVALRKEAPRKGAGLRPGKAAHQRSRRAELAAKMRAVGSKNLTPKEQMQMAAWRARSVIRNIKRRDVRPSGRSAYKLSKAEEKRLYNKLYDQKLKEIKAGITWGDRQTVSHHFPQKAISEYGGDPFGSGLTTMANITDAAGNFAFLPQRINSSLGNIIPRSLLNLK